MKRTFLQRGFTLIEVLVVIAIIGILSAIIYANFSDARQDARNKALRSEIKAVQLALELYKAQNDNYPADEDDLVPEFIADLPTANDSANPYCFIDYNYDATGGWYKYTAERCFAGAEDDTEGIQPEDTMARCPVSCVNNTIGTQTCNSATYADYIQTADFYETFAIYSVGGQCE